MSSNHNILYTSFDVIWKSNLCLCNMAADMCFCLCLGLMNCPGRTRSKPRHCNSNL